MSLAPLSRIRTIAFDAEHSIIAFVAGQLSLGHPSPTPISYVVSISGSNNLVSEMSGSVDSTSAVASSSAPTDIVVVPSSGIPTIVVLTFASEALTMAITGLQRQMGDLATNVADVKNRPPSPASTQP